MTADEALPAAAARIFAAMRRARFAQVLAGRGESVPASEAARVAADEAQQALTLMHSVGILPPSAQQAVDARGLDLAALRAFDSPKARALLRSLEETERVAAEFDRERGQGEEGGDWAELVAALRIRLDLEMFGPSERVTGGRE